jgi:hypothetical protein
MNRKNRGMAVFAVHFIPTDSGAPTASVRLEVAAFSPDDASIRARKQAGPIIISKVKFVRPITFAASQQEQS